MTEPQKGESLLTFPCVFPLKVMGRREDGFAQVVSEVVMRHAPDINEGTLKLEIRPITEAEVRTADEVWLSSSTKEVLAVTTIDGQPVGRGVPGALFKRMHALFQDHKAKLLERKKAAA